MAEETEEDQDPLIPALLRDDPGLSQLMDHFHSGVSGHHQALQKALADGDSETIKQQARQLRSVGSNYKCPELTELAGQLEFAATASNGRAVRELVGKLGALARRVGNAVSLTTSMSLPPEAESPLVSELLREGYEMADLVEYFVSRLPGYEQSLQTALAAGDFLALKKQAHDLKSVGGGYGYPLVNELAVNLEASAVEGDQNAVTVHVETFSRLAQRIRVGAATLPHAAAAVG
jgi:HPt (histidine-containing phosphotransfer) domain-containing protein